MNESPNEMIPQEKVTPRVPLNSKFWLSVLNYTPEADGNYGNCLISFYKVIYTQGYHLSQ